MELTLNILCYPEDGEWVALALEMDIRGYGATPDEAWSELRDLVDAQIAFAKEKGAPELIWFNAEDRYWDMYRAAQRQEMAARLAASAFSTCDVRTGGMPLTSAYAADAPSLVNG